MMLKSIYSIIVFASLVLFHELGHFVFAKLTGVMVYEFSIGFGPRLLGFRIGETAYNLRIIPLGGFVRMAGMDPEEDNRENAELSSERSFSHKSILQRMSIIASGPIMNFVLAIILFAGAFLWFGVPLNKNIIGDVLPGRPAAQAGLKAGDTVNKINDKSVKSWEDMVTVIHKNPNKTIDLEILRDGQNKHFNVKTDIDPETKVGMIGISYPSRTPSFFEAIKIGCEKTYEMLKLTTYFLGKMIARQMPVELSGPVRITVELGKAAETGMSSLINFAAFLSIQIGLFNLLPIPALDGSRLLFLGIEGLRGRPIDSSKENMIHLVGLVLMLLLMVVVTYQDIVKMLG